MSKIKCVEIVKNDDGVIPCQNKYPFQVSWHIFSTVNFWAFSHVYYFTFKFPVIALLIDFLQLC